MTVPRTVFGSDQVPNLDGSALDAVLNAVVHLRQGLVMLDDIGLCEAAAHVDAALEVLEPLHPEVVAGALGPRPLPGELRDWLGELS